MACDLAAGLAVIVHPPQVVAVRHGRERAVEGKNLQPMLRQVQITNDLGPQQGNDVGADGKLEARENLLGAGSAAEDMTPLQHQDFSARASKIRGVDQPVVTASDNDSVVLA